MKTKFDTNTTTYDTRSLMVIDRYRSRLKNKMTFACLENAPWIIINCLSVTEISPMLFNKFSICLLF